MSEESMYVIAEPRRTELLRGYGVSEAVISLGNGGELPDEVFDFYCLKPKTTLTGHDQKDADIVVGIFESRYDDAYGCRKGENGLEFVCFNVKHPTEIDVLGSSEQSLLGMLFEEIIDAEFHGRDPLTRAADAIGFKYLMETYAYVFSERELAIKGERKRDMKAYFDRRLAFIRGLSKTEE